MNFQLNSIVVSILIVFHDLFLLESWCCCSHEQKVLFERHTHEFDSLIHFSNKCCSVCVSSKWSKKEKASRLTLTCLNVLTWHEMSSWWGSGLAWVEIKLSLSLDWERSGGGNNSDYHLIGLFELFMCLIFNTC